MKINKAEATLRRNPVSTVNRPLDLSRSRSETKTPAADFFWWSRLPAIALPARPAIRKGAKNANGETSFASMRTCANVGSSVAARGLYEDPVERELFRGFSSSRRGTLTMALGE